MCLVQLILQVDLVVDRPQYVTSRSGLSTWSYGVEYKETVRAASDCVSSSPETKSSAGAAVDVRCTARALPGTQRPPFKKLGGARSVSP